MRKGVRSILLATLFGLSILILGLYFGRFAPAHLGHLSQDSEDWARFGEYVGGTLGPLFALAAFGAALWALSVSQHAARIARSAVLYEHAISSIQEACRLIEQTLDIQGELDPGRGNLSHWYAAALLLKKAQFLRQKEFAEDPHDLLYDKIELPRYRLLFRKLVNGPYGFDPKKYYTGGWPEHGTGRGVTADDWINGQTLSVIYRFASGRDTSTLTVEEEPRLSELAVGMYRGPAPPGWIEYSELLDEKGV
jgi:hypothetical protein